MPPPVPFDRFLGYDELTATLKELASSAPSLFSLDSIGTSYEGRDIWLATITDTGAGAHDEKPALWVDANIHATEHTGTVACLHLAWRLLQGVEDGDADVVRAVRTRTFYLCPRMNPDGAERALTDPAYLRSSVRHYPRLDQQDGLVEKDVDGDGRILTMRVVDPNGAWKADPYEPRLLVPREPTEDGPGPYYRLLPEGEVRGFDGEHVAPAPRLLGLDLNRNFPADWKPEHQQAGAGPYPTSEPEVRAVVQAIVDRPNIVSYFAFHTFTGVHLRPSGTHPDDHLPTWDLLRYKEIGKKATSLTGYPAVSVFHDFAYDPKETITGVGDDWAYEQRGCFAWTTEFWSPMRDAGIDLGQKVLEWFDEHPVEDDRTMLRWNDEVLGGTGYVDWYPFEHPQLGPVELGGWWHSHCFRNPPPERLLGEVAPHSELLIWHNLISPLLRLRKVGATALGPGVWEVVLVVENSGWLPTNGTEKAMERKVVRPLEVRVEHEDGDGLEVVGRDVLELGQLTGRAGKRGGFGGASVDATTDRAVARFVVRAAAGTEVRLTARHQRAGVVRTSVVLGAGS